MEAWSAFCGRPSIEFVAGRCFTGSRIPRKLKEHEMAAGPGFLEICLAMQRATMAELEAVLAELERRRGRAGAPLDDLVDFRWGG